jgi:hypothetical protein
MRTYTQEEIEQLITCPKQIAEPPKKEWRIERGSKRKDMTLVATADKKEFTVFIRVNVDFEENFSVGLEYNPKEEKGTFCLLRCNGPHGEFIGGDSAPSVHFRYHIHKAKAENIEAGMRPERGAEPTDKYASYRDALRVFLETIGVTNMDEYFPDLRQMALALDERKEPQE